MIFLFQLIKKHIAILCALVYILSCVYYLLFILFLYYRELQEPVQEDVPVQVPASSATKLVEEMLDAAAESESVQDSVRFSYYLLFSQPRILMDY